MILWNRGKGHLFHGSKGQILRGTDNIGEHKKQVNNPIYFVQTGNTLTPWERLKVAKTLCGASITGPTHSPMY